MFMVSPFWLFASGFAATCDVFDATGAGLTGNLMTSGGRRNSGKFCFDGSGVG
jgi:hypothetical protein